MTELDRRVEGLAAHQHGIFSSRQVLLHGNHDMLRHRLATGRWQREARGLYRLLGAPATTESRLMAAILASGGRGVVSHESAAWLRELPGFGPSSLAISVPRGTRLGRFEDVVVHRSNILPAQHRSTVRHLPVSTTARVLFELTAVVRLGRVARAMDTAIARRQVDYLDLVRMLGDVSRKGRRRTRWFRVLLAERGPLYVPPESELERRFLALVTTPDLGDWDRQVDLGGAEGWVGRVDFFQRRSRLVVEVDGRVAHSSFLDRRSDAERDRDLQAAGFTVLRFGWAEVVGDAERVRATIRSALAANAT